MSQGKIPASLQLADLESIAQLEKRVKLQRVERGRSVRR